MRTRTRVGVCEYDLYDHYRGLSVGRWETPPDRGYTRVPCAVYAMVYCYDTAVKYYHMRIRRRRTVRLPGMGKTSSNAVDHSSRPLRRQLVGDSQALPKKKIVYKQTSYQEFTRHFQRLNQFPYRIKVLSLRFLYTPLPFRRKFLGTPRINVKINSDYVP